MSVNVMSKVWSHSRSKGAARLVLLAIADHANHSGVAWPSLRRIAQYCNVDASNVSRCINQLVKLGELERIGYTRPFNGTTKYKVKVMQNRTSAILHTSAVSHDGTSAVSHERPVQYRTTNHQRTIKENRHIDIGHFDDFWTQYPKKVAKAPARKSYEKALTKVTHEDIMEGLAKYNPDPQYICNPATWLNQERWNDEPANSQPNGTASSQSRQDGNRHTEAYQRFVARRTADQ